MEDLKSLSENNWRNLLELYDDVHIHAEGIVKREDPLLSYFSYFYGWPKFSIIDCANVDDPKYFDSINNAIEIGHISPFILVNPVYHADGQLGKELDRHGIRQIGQWPLIYYDLSKNLPIYEHPEDFEIKLASDDETISHWNRIVQTVLFDSKPLPSLRFDPDKYVLSVGYESGVPVGSVLTYSGSSSSSGHMVAVMPEFREKGYGKIIFRHSLAMSSEKGYSLFFAQSSSMGLKPWLKLGFEISGYVDVMWKVGHTITQKGEQYND